MLWAFPSGVATKEGCKRNTGVSHRITELFPADVFG